MGQGENARAFLKDNKDIRQEIKDRLRQGLGLPLIDVAAEPMAAASGSKAAVVQMPDKKRQPDKSA
jgi:hypothetical protein